MDANTLMPRKWRWDHNHLAVVQLIPAPVIGPPAQLGEADSRIHSAHAVHSTSSVCEERAVRESFDICPFRGETVAEITTAFGRAVR